MVISHEIGSIDDGNMVSSIYNVFCGVYIYIYIYIYHHHILLYNKIKIKIWEHMREIKFGGGEGILLN